MTDLTTDSRHAEPRVSTLNNGLRVVSEQVPGLCGVTVGIWLGTGSIHERPGSGGAPSEFGGMHFLEHVLFKGTRRYTGAEIAAQMDLVGADFNAFTGKEHTCFHAQVPAENLSAVIEILASVVAEGTCTDADVEIERGVIIDELAGRDDDPEDLATELGYEMALPHHPLGRSILGSTSDVESLTAATLRALHHRALDPASIVVAAVGPVVHEDLVDDVNKTTLAQLPQRDSEKLRLERAFSSPRLHAHPGALHLLRMPGQQLHLCLSALGPARDDELRPATHLAATVLGGGVSSRLFSRVRERHGIAYNVFAGVEQFAAASVVQISASAPMSRAAELLAATATELDAFAAEPPSDEELIRAKAYVRGAIVLGRDDPMARMTRLGRHTLDRGRVHPVADSLSRIEAVSPEDVAAAWHQLTARGWHAVLLGPTRRRAALRLASELERHTRQSPRAG